MGSAKKAFKSVTSWVTSPVDAVKSLVKGDIGGVVDAALRSGTGGMAGINKGGFVNVNDLTGVNAMKDAADAQMAEAKSLIEEQKNASTKATETANAARRAYHASDSRTVYTTALGDVAETASANKRKRTLLGS